MERAKFIKGFTTKNGDNKKGEANALELKELGADLAEKILKFWMSNINRTLTNFQVRIAKPFCHQGQKIGMLIFYANLQLIANLTFDTLISRKITNKVVSRFLATIECVQVQHSVEICGFYCHSDFT